MNRIKTYTCGYCRHSSASKGVRGLRGHYATGCPVQQFRIWSNGCELYVARSATEAVKLGIETMEMPKPMEDWVRIPAEDWEVLDGFIRLRIQGVCRPFLSGELARLNGTGLLAFADGELANPERFVR